MSELRYAFDLYPRDDPRDGDRIIRFSQLEAAEWNAEANGTGSGFLVLPGDATDADSIDPAGLQYVRVVEIDPDSVDGGTLSGFAERVVFGFFLDSGTFDALTERNTKRLTFGGAGTLSYLDRSIMAPHTYLDIAIGQDPFDDTWRLYAQGPLAGGDMLGAVLWRVIYEAQHFRVALTQHRHVDGIIYTDSHPADDRVESAIPDLTLGFDAFDDSDGNPWAEDSGEFKAQTGEGVLGVVQRLMEAELYVSMDPDTFELNAWPAATHRRTRTGVAWGTSVIRFQSPTDGTLATGNILSDAKRAIAAFIRRSWMLVGGGDVYGDFNSGADIPWEGFYRADVNSASAATTIATTQSNARDDAGDTLQIRTVPIDDPTNGLYRPLDATGVLLDDLVTVHSGAGQWDFDEQVFPVAAVGGKLRDGGDWDILIKLGASFSVTERRFAVAGAPSHSHLPNPQLCDPTVPGSPDTEILHMHWTDGLQESYTDADSVVQDAPGSASAVSSGAGSDGESGFVNFKLADTADGIRDIPATAGVTYRFDFDTRYGGGIDIEFANGGTGLTTTRIATHTEGNVWVARSATLTAPPTTDRIQFKAIGAGHYDHVRITALSDSEGSDPLAGNSNRAARCDHKHLVLTDRAPGATDDTDAGYPEGTLWHDETTGSTFILVDGTTDAAEWQPIGNSSVGDHSHAETVIEDDTGSAYTVDVSLGTVYDLTLTDDATLTFDGAVDGQADSFTLILHQPSAGGPYTVTWPASVVWPDDTEPTLSIDPDAVDILTFLTVDGGTTWFGFMGGSGSAASALIVREVAGSDIDPVAELEFDADDFVVTDQTGGVARVALAAGAVTADEIAAFGFVGPLLISDTPSTPLVFADLIQNEAQDDLVYADI